MKFLGEYLKGSFHLHSWTLTDDYRSFGRPRLLNRWLDQHPDATILSITQYSMGHNVYTTIWYKEDAR